MPDFAVTRKFDGISWPRMSHPGNYLKNRQDSHDCGQARKSTGWRR
jgi:hypothetical protein